VRPTSHPSGAVAGVLGTGFASVIVWAADLDVTWWHLALITPVATVLAGLAGLWPAWQASRATPIDALRDNARPPRRAGRPVVTVTGLALTSLRRLPGRTFLGAASLLVGVAALTTLIALQAAFRAGAEGTALGDVISVQVRGVDFLAAAVTIALGAFAVADIAYLNIAERTAEIGTLRSTGWSEGHIRRLFATEAFTTALLGAAGGAGLAVAAVALALPAVPIATSLQAAALALTGGTLAAMLATTGPVARLHRIAPAAALSE
jgi:putative ABC transport system permease protein